VQHVDAGGRLLKKNKGLSPAEYRKTAREKYRDNI